MSDFIDGLARLTSVGALGATFWSLQRNSKERRLAATPHLIFSRAYEPSREFDGDNGVGPAKLVEFTFLLDGRPILLRNTRQLEELCAQLRMAAVFEGVADLELGGDDPRESTKKIIEIKKIELLGDEERDLHQILKRLSAAVTYRSFCDELYPKVTADTRC